MIDYPNIDLELLKNITRRARANNSGVVPMIVTVQTMNIPTIVKFFVFRTISPSELADMDPDKMMCLSYHRSYQEK